MCLLKFSLALFVTYFTEILGLPYESGSVLYNDQNYAAREVKEIKDSSADDYSKISFKKGGARKSRVDYYEPELIDRQVSEEDIDLKLAKEFATFKEDVKSVIYDKEGLNETQGGAPAEDVIARAFKKYKTFQNEYSSREGLPNTQEIIYAYLEQVKSSDTGSLIGQAVQKLYRNKKTGIIHAMFEEDIPYKNIHRHKKMSNDGLNGDVFNFTLNLSAIFPLIRTDLDVPQNSMVRHNDTIGDRKYRNRHKKPGADYALEKYVEHYMDAKVQKKWLSSDRSKLPNIYDFFLPNNTDKKRGPNELRNLLEAYHCKSEKANLGQLPYFVKISTILPHMDYKSPKTTDRWHGMKFPFIDPKGYTRHRVFKSWKEMEREYQKPEKIFYDRYLEAREKKGSKGGYKGLGKEERDDYMRGVMENIFNKYPHGGLPSSMYQLERKGMSPIAISDGQQDAGIPYKCRCNETDLSSTTIPICGSELWINNNKKKSGGEVLTSKVYYYSTKVTTVEYVPEYQSVTNHDDDDLNRERLRCLESTYQSEERITDATQTSVYNINSFISETVTEATQGAETDSEEDCDNENGGEMNKDFTKISADVYIIPKGQKPPFNKFFVGRDQHQPGLYIAKPKIESPKTVHDAPLIDMPTMITNLEYTSTASLLDKTETNFPANMEFVKDTTSVIYGDILIKPNMYMSSIQKVMDKTLINLPYTTTPSLATNTVGRIAVNKFKTQFHKLGPYNKPVKSADAQKLLMAVLSRYGKSSNNYESHPALIIGL